MEVVQVVYRSKIKFVSCVLTMSLVLECFTLYTTDFNKIWCVIYNKSKVKSAVCQRYPDVIPISPKSSVSIGPLDRSCVTKQNMGECAFFQLLSVHCSFQKLLFSSVNIIIIQMNYLAPFWTIIGCLAVLVYGD